MTSINDTEMCDLEMQIWGKRGRPRRSSPAADLPVSTSIALAAWSSRTGTDYDCRVAWANVARAYGL